MPWFLWGIVKWVIACAALTALGRGLWIVYALVRAGESLSALPIVPLVLDVMRLHVAAAWGAAAGVVCGLLAQSPRVVRLAVRRLRARADSPDKDQRTPDAIIRAERARIAEAWLKEHDKRNLDFVAIDGDDGPAVENIVTARGGRFTYRVMAYRHLTEQERKEVVLDALERGLLKEPEPGGTATLLTSIGQ